jgi:acetolactate synthase-1/3 small subunit
MVIDQIMAQIAKLVPVIRVRDLTDDPDRFDLEFTLLRVDVSGPKQEEAVLVAHQFGAVLRRTKPDSLFFLYEKPGLEAFQEIAAALGKLGNVAVARTGLVALGGRKSQGPQVP